MQLRGSSHRHVRAGRNVHWVTTDWQRTSSYPWRKLMGLKETREPHPRGKAVMNAERGSGSFYVSRLSACGPRSTSFIRTGRVLSSFTSRDTNVTDPKQRTGDDVTCHAPSPHREHARQKTSFPRRRHRVFPTVGDCTQPQHRPSHPTSPLHQSVRKPQSAWKPLIGEAVRPLRNGARDDEGDSD